MFGWFQSLFGKKSTHPVVSYVQEHFGYTPINASLYIQAVTHKSANEGVEKNNERLEFLGDAILDSVAAHYLIDEYPNEFEGFLTRKRAEIVSRRTLNRMAIETGLEQLVDANLEQDPKRTSIGGNALEALIGAMYLDKGYDFTLRVFQDRIIKHYISLPTEERPFDPKSRLIEFTQKNKLSIRFETNDFEGESKFKEYKCAVLIDEIVKGEGIGTSKKKAEQQASLQALQHLDNV